MKMKEANEREREKESERKEERKKYIYIYVTGQCGTQANLESHIGLVQSGIQLWTGLIPGQSQINRSKSVQSEIRLQRSGES